MKLAVKFQSQNPNNPDGIPTFWPWKQTPIADESQSEFEANGWTVMTENELKDYISNKMSGLQNFYLKQVRSSANFWDISIDKRIEFANHLMERFKRKNINEGINAIQALWMHNRVRALDIVFYSVPMKIDLLNLVISGDIEVAVLTLQNCIPDDGSMPFHWMTQARVNWLITEMKSFLGWP